MADEKKLAEKAEKAADKAVPPPALAAKHVPAPLVIWRVKHGTLQHNGQTFETRDTTPFDDKQVQALGLEHCLERIEL